MIRSMPVCPPQVPNHLIGGGGWNATLRDGIIIPPRYAAADIVEKFWSYVTETENSELKIVVLI
jgi:hypothetical protein